MAKKSTKNRDEMMLATIRINAGLWQDFQLAARHRYTNASAVIVEYVEAYVDRDRNRDTDNEIHTDELSDTDSNGETKSRDTDKLASHNTDVDTDALREQLLADIVAKLDGGYLAEVLNQAVATCSLPEEIGKLESDLRSTKVELEQVVEDAETAKKDLRDYKAKSGKRLLDVENVIENLDVTTDNLAGSVMAQEKLVAALNESSIELRQEVYALNNQLAQVRCHQREIETANAELVQRNRELMVKLTENLDKTICVSPSEVYQPETVVGEVPVGITGDNVIVIPDNSKDNGITVADNRDDNGIINDNNSVIPTENNSGITKAGITTDGNTENNGWVHLLNDYLKNPKGIAQRGTSRWFSQKELAEIASTSVPNVAQLNPTLEKHGCVIKKIGRYHKYNFDNWNIADIQPGGINNV